MEPSAFAEQQPSSLVAAAFSRWSSSRCLSLEQQPLSQLEQQPSWLEQRPSSLEQQPSSAGAAASSLEQQPSSLEQQPSSLEQQPSSLEQQPFWLEQQPSGWSSSLLAASYGFSGSRFLLGRLSWRPVFLQLPSCSQVSEQSTPIWWTGSDPHE